ncbi:major royal jelly protein 5-like [Biomphalaria glabrata]|uniref:Major royal jelly protein 5-like n=1 Tax=Biomphalaria glabrata TaxID=6526 RepID=A0A9W3BGW4_BIOGL|nr:major royal jelly protein 5-like [Biomphalaria glabrata]
MYSSHLNFKAYRMTSPATAKILLPTLLTLVTIGALPVTDTPLNSRLLLNPSQLPKVEVIHEWVSLDYDWRFSWVKDYYTERGWFDAKQNLLSSIDIYNGDIYVTVIRLSVAVPSGLNKVVSVQGKPVLQPFPSFGRNEIGICSNLQFPFASFTDPNTGYMYVVDVGRIGRNPNAQAPCPPKLVVLDLNNKGALLRSHSFPEAVVPRHTNMVNDLVLDYVTVNSTEVKYVYITDTGNAQIIVFDVQTNQTWAFRDVSMKTDADRVFMINGVNYTMDVPVDGIAIDREYNFVYYSAVGSRKFYQIPTSVLRNNSGDFAPDLRLVGNKVSNSDGMASGKTNIYYGAGGLNALFRWPITKDMETQGSTESNVTMATQSLLAQDDNLFRWVDSMKLDTNGYLWFVSNRAPEYLNGNMDFTGAKGANFRICRVFVDDLPYLLKS